MGIKIDSDYKTRIIKLVINHSLSFSLRVLPNHELPSALQRPFAKAVLLNEILLKKASDGLRWGRNKLRYITNGTDK